MSILDRVLEMKEWCRIAGQDGKTADRETVIRRQAFHWMLKELLRGCKTRETFTEIGPWVSYPQALLWALKDYEEAGLDSWIIQYPLCGFRQIIHWYEMMDEPVNRKRIEMVCEAKLLHTVVTRIMNAMLRQQDEAQQSTEWTYPFMSLIYRDFNAPSVPGDMNGAESVVTAPEFWFKRGDTLGNGQFVESFLSMFSTEDHKEMHRRIQLAVYWAIFTQRGHTGTKTFFHKIEQREPFASLVLGKSTDLRLDVPEAPVMEVLTSIFRAHPHFPQGDVIHSEAKCPPFASPYGASVLRCGFEGCKAKFYHPKPDCATITAPDVNIIRQQRAKHFHEVFGDQHFVSDTGLPEPTRAPKAPTSSHCNLHRSIAKVWSRMHRTCKICHNCIPCASAATYGLPTKEAVFEGDDQAVNAFISEVIQTVCVRNGRGDICHPNLETKIWDLLRSFFKALRVASKKLGLEGPLDYVHDWTQNSLEAKISYEINLESV